MYIPDLLLALNLMQLIAKIKHYNENDKHRDKNDSWSLLSPQNNIKLKSIKLDEAVEENILKPQCVIHHA